MRVQITYIASSGKSYNLISDGIRHRKANYHEWEWDPETTKLQYGERVAGWSKGPGAYETELQFYGSEKQRRERVEEMLEKVGLGDKMKNYPNQLSGGQQQRVAIARAIATNPTILLADEPTGALDQKTGKQVMALFRELNDEGRTIIMITHDMNIARNARRVVHIIDGELTEGGETSDA